VGVEKLKWRRERRVFWLLIWGNGGAREAEKETSTFI
jgi:hypothetical protein